jgi:Secretion system C-terminal sorting domain
MKKNLKPLIAVAMTIFICIQTNAQTRSWTKNGSTSFNQTTGCGNCLGMLWSAPGEAHLDYGYGTDDVAPPLNAAYVNLAAYNSCVSPTNCYYTRGMIVNDFQYSFPTNVNITITGIQVIIFGQAVKSNTIKDMEVQLVYNGAAIGANRKKTAYWPNTYTGRTYGSSTDLWGINWTAAMISDPGWGFEIKVQNMNLNSTRRFILDWGYVIVYYTVSSLSPGLSGGETKAKSIADNKPDFELFPNPTRDILSIVAKKDLDNFEVVGFDSEGQSVFVKSAVDLKENELFKIDVSTLPKGIYFLQIVSNGLNYTKKFVKD